MGIISGGQVIAGALPRGQTPLDKSEGAKVGRGLVIAKATYDFSVEGGAVSTIGLLGSLAMPSGLVIMGGFVQVRTIPTSGGAATIALTTGEGAGDLVAAAAYNGAPWSTTGKKNVVPRLSDATTWITLTAARDLSAVIAAAALTAGVFDLYLFYLPPSD